MTAKRVLLLHEDRLLANLFREKLENANFAVETARDGETGLKIAGERRPDAVVMDSVLPGPELAKLVPQLRALGGKQPLPVVVLPNIRPIFAEAAQEAGAVALTETRGRRIPLADIVDALQTALKLEKTSAHARRSLVFRAEDSWLKMSLGAAPEVLSGPTCGARCTKSAGKGQRGGFGQVFSGVLSAASTGFAEQMAALGQKPLHYLTAQIEALAYDLSTFPEQINPSVLRNSLSQALDFLATLPARCGPPQIERSRRRASAGGG